MRMRVTVRPTGDRARDLMVAAAVRRGLIAEVPVGVDPDYPLHGTHRDREGRAYFEFATDSPEGVRRAARQCGHRVEATEVEGGLGEECVNCGNVVPGVLPAVCPNCGFRDISPCPNCDQLIARSEYRSLGGDSFGCPHCHARVRLRYHDPLFAADGEYLQPLVLVEETAAGHEIR